MIDTLVEYDVNLDDRDTEDQTALLKSVQKNSGDGTRVKTLISHGANVYAKDNAGRADCSSSSTKLKRWHTAATPGAWSGCKRQRQAWYNERPWGLR